MAESGWIGEWRLLSFALIDSDEAQKTRISVSSRAGSSLEGVPTQSADQPAASGFSMTARACQS
jgi:hypothetical protein